MKTIMNTESSDYVGKISSGLVLALLAFSGFLLMLPVSPVAVAFNPGLPTVTVTSNNPVTGGSSQQFTFLVSNPTGNTYTITGFTVLAPSGWTVTNCSPGGFLPVCNTSGSGNSVTYSVSQFTVGTAAGIPPGASDTLKFTATAPTGSSSQPYPFNSVFSSKVQDASSVQFYNGPTFAIQVIDPTTGVTVNVVPNGGNSVTQYAAGTAPYTVTASVTCTVSPACPNGVEQGISVSFSAPGYGPTTVFSFTPSSGATNSSGMLSTTFQPSNKAGDSTFVKATLGTSSISGTSASAITTVAGPPSKLTFTFSSAASNGNYYVTSEGTTVNTASGNSFTGAKVPATAVSFAISDQFGNPQTFNNPLLTAFTITLTTTSSAGGLFDANGLPTSISCSKGGNWYAGATNLGGSCPSTGSSANIPFNYFQSATWGTIGQISGSVTGTFNGNSFGGPGQTGSIVTSTFAGSAPAPVATGTSTTCPNTLITCLTSPPAVYVTAGTKANVTATLNPPSTCGAGASPCPPQPGVPVTLLLDAATSYETTAGAKDYGVGSVLMPGFSNGALNITLNTNKAGKVSALFTVDTVAAAVAKFQSIVAAPTNANPSGTLGLSADSNPAETIPGTPTSFTVLTAFDSSMTKLTMKAAASTPSFKNSLFVDVIISDSYGNLAVNPGPSNIQVMLTLSPTSPAGGLLTATTAYISAGCSDTAGTLGASCGTPFGTIQWTMPSTYPGTLTLTASGVINNAQVSNSTTVSVVSPMPTFALKQPKAGAFGAVYTSTNTVFFVGQANVSKGYSGINVKTISYSVDGGAPQSVTITSAPSVSFQILLSFTNGLHRIQFNVTDTAGNTLAGTPVTILSDSKPPTITFTPKSGSSLTSSQPLVVTVNDPYGDLNTTLGAKGIMVSVNGTALTSGVTVTPSASASLLGTSTNYTITITSLPTGKDVVTVTVMDYAGNSATATATVTVVVPFAVSVLVNSATYGTLGSFNGILVSATNRWSSTQNLVVFAVWKNSAGQTVAVTTGGLTLTPGQTGQTFAALPGALAPGTYTVNVFVVTVSNQPVSTTTTITVTV
jgi:hypothetical protein